jgi:Flp pilus assembly pilin Flp
MLREGRRRDCTVRCATRRRRAPASHGDVLGPRRFCRDQLAAVAVIRSVLALVVVLAMAAAVGVVFAKFKGCPSQSATKLNNTRLFDGLGPLSPGSTGSPPKQLAPAS